MKIKKETYVKELEKMQHTLDAFIGETEESEDIYWSLIRAGAAVYRCVQKAKEM